LAGVGRAYFERCIPVVHRRLARAGVRLAEVLNAIFAGGQSQATESGPANPQGAGPAPSFVGSRHSGVCHYPECSVVGRIKPNNLVKYDAAPERKRLHKGCPR
jgi:hypothetical protein